MSELEALYQGIILDHARTPENTGSTVDWALRSRQLNPTCGDEVTVAVRLDGDRIEAVRWEGHGCAIAQASASLLSGLATGVSRAEAAGLIDGFREVMRSRGSLELDEERFADAVALQGVSRYLGRVKCALLAWVALENALAAD